MSAVAVAAAGPSMLRIVVYRRQMSEILEIKARKLYAEAESAILTFQFPTNDAERTSGDALCRRRHVLRVPVLLYSWSIEGLYERDTRKSKQEKQEKLYAKVEHIPSNFRTPTPKERLSVPAVCPPCPYPALQWVN